VRGVRLHRFLLAVPLLAATVLTSTITAGADRGGQAPTTPTATPVKHLVVIFQENVSFDHYFATYPKAANRAGESRFTAKSGTPSVNGLTDELLTDNPNASNPQRLSPAQALTCDQDHEYADEQASFNHGLMDKFIETVGTATGNDPKGQPCQARQVMDYYDGNTVTALWNYAQRFAMSDNSYGTTFGPSTPGAVNLVSGQTHGVGATATPGTSSLTGEVANGTIIGDPQPLGDICSTRDQARLTGRNIGDLLNDKGVTWGFFEGGFRSCSAKHPVGAAVGGTGQYGTKADYIPHHEPFQYYTSTANLQHLPPSSVGAIGSTDQANHQYDLPDFWAAVDNGNMPAVSYLKAAGYQDGHAGYSDPIDEQVFLVNTLNRLQQTKEWKDTAVVIAYDDSDGFYDHQMSPIVNQSQSADDRLTDPGQCGNNPARVSGGYEGRCGYGPRLPMLVVSPWARQNFVDHAITDQSSILRFVEDNWGTGRIGDSSFDAKAGSLANLFDFGRDGRADRLILDPSTGQPSGENAGRRD
jgi:phospholipase C